VVIKKKKMGRPALPKDRRRANITTLRLQPEERELYEKAASREGLTLSEWIRKTLKSAI
jgi:uncharacterized protein (DUF1778 family)